MHYNVLKSHFSKRWWTDPSQCTWAEFQYQSTVHFWFSYLILFKNDQFLAVAVMLKERVMKYSHRAVSLCNGTLPAFIWSNTCIIDQRDQTSRLFSLWLNEHVQESQGKTTLPVSEHLFLNVCMLLKAIKLFYLCVCQSVSSDILSMVCLVYTRLVYARLTGFLFWSLIWMLCFHVVLDVIIASFLIIVHIRNHMACKTLEWIPGWTVGYSVLYFCMCVCTVLYRVFVWCNEWWRKPSKHKTRH